MSVSQAPSSSPAQLPTSDPQLRDRVSGAFEKLASSASELNAVSDELAKPIAASMRLCRNSTSAYRLG